MEVSSIGALQGTVLAPLLFTLYTADFMSVIYSSSVMTVIVHLVTGEDDKVQRTETGLVS